MTEDFQVQQQRPSAAPYILGGALVGGAAGTGATFGIKKVGDWVSEPGKYNSFQDIVNEAEDEFTKKMETVEDKDLVTKAKEARQRIADGNAQWEKDKADYLEKNKGERLAELPNDHELIKKKNDLQKKLSDLEAITGETKTETYKKDLLAALRKTSRSLSDAGEKLQELRKNGASAEEIAKQTEYIKTLEQKQSSIYDRILEAVKFDGTAEEIAKSKKNFRAQLEEHVQTYLHNTDLNRVPLNNDYVKATTALNNAKESAKNAIAEIETLTGYKLQNSGNLGKNRIDVIKKISKNKVDVFEEILKNYNAATSASSNLSFWDRLENAYRALQGKDPVNFANTDTAVKDFIANLTEEEKKLLGDSEVTKENIEKLLNNAKKNRDSINDAFDRLSAANNEVTAQNKAINKLKKALKKGQHYNDAGEICVNGKPIGEIYVNGKRIKSTKTNPVPTLDKAVADKLPREMEFTRTITSGAANPEEIQSAKDAIKNVETEIQQAREKLPKIEAKTPEELEKEFIEKYGKKGEKVTESVKAELEDSLKKLWEKGAKNKGKVAAVIGSAAALGAIVGLMFKPNNQA